MRWSSIKFYVQPYSTERPPRNQMSWYMGHHKFMFWSPYNSVVLFLCCLAIFILNGTRGEMRNTFKIFVQIRFKDWGTGKEMTLKIFTHVGRDTADWIYLAQNTIQCPFPGKRVSRNCWGNRATFVFSWRTSVRGSVTWFYFSLNHFEGRHTVVFYKLILQ